MNIGINIISDMNIMAMLNGNLFCVTLLYICRRCDQKLSVVFTDIDYNVVCNTFYRSIYDILMHL